MTVTLDRRTLWIVAICLALGWWLGSSPASPVNPSPQPDRPVLTAIARLARVAARWGLWAAMLAEQPPEQQEQRIVRHMYDSDGHPVVDHAEGW